MVDRTDPEAQDAARGKRVRQRALLALNILALALGGTAGPTLSKLYFVHGGSRKWLTTWLQSAGCPILVVPLWMSRARRFDHVTPRLLAFCCAVGALTGLTNFLYTWGVPYLPMSTSQLLSASQLAFNAGFAFLLVRQRFTPYSINSVLLLTAGSVLLGLRANGDRPHGVTHRQYVAGFGTTIGAAALTGLVFPLIQLMYRTAKCEVTYGLVVEMQLATSVSATVFGTVGMLANRDFRAIRGEARAFGLGQVNYYMTVVWTAIAWQLLVLGASGVIFLTSSLMNGILTVSLIPATQILGVLIFHDKFTGEKGMAVVLILWGFASYLYEQRKLSDIDVNRRRRPSLVQPDKQEQIEGTALADGGDGLK